MTVIELPDEQAAALRARAAAAGLTLEAWLKQLAEAEDETPTEHPLRTAADIVLECMRQVPPELMRILPTDGANQHDHYLYGWPKKET
jgi:plasmid stability protein